MYGETREAAAERFVHSLLVFGKGMPEDELGQKITDAPVSVFCCRVTGTGVVYVSIVLIECRCPTYKSQQFLLTGLTQEGQRHFVDCHSQYRRI